MRIINISKQKEYFQKTYCCEILTSNEVNKCIINGFKANQYGKHLELYLKELAWKEDKEGETRFYLVKDRKCQAVLFFSIKCGLLYEPYKFAEIDSDELEFVDLLLKAIEQNDNETIKNYFDSNYYSPEKFKKLYDMAEEKLNIKKESSEIMDDSSTYKVSKCFSAIELCHLCKNSNYSSNNNEIPIGFGIFWEIIVPKILEINKLVGCKYLYLFAADQTESDSRTKKLLEYYKNDLKFYEVQNMKIIKPEYDSFCYALVQEISELKNNREIVWEEYSHV